MANIGKKIAERRKELGLTQEELAHRMGYKSKSTINKIELGINDIPQSKVVKFSDVLGVSIAYLMDWEEVEKKADDLASIFTVLYDDEELQSAVQALVRIKKNDPVNYSNIAALIKGLDK